MKKEPKKRFKNKRGSVSKRYLMKGEQEIGRRKRQIARGMLQPTKGVSDG